MSYRASRNFLQNFLTGTGGEIEIVYNFIGAFDFEDANVVYPMAIPSACRGS